MLKMVCLHLKKNGLPSRISRLPANHAHPPVSVAHSNVGTSPRQLDKEEELLLYCVAVAYWSGLDAKI